MSSRPWMKFYPRDWRGDQGLRAVSLAARGLAMECLCLMHEAEPRGHLLLNGRKVEVDALARMTGSLPDEVSALMAELLTAGVFSRLRNDVVVSRRMIRDEKAAQEGAKSVSKRWTQAADAKRENPHPNRSGERSPSSPPITQKPEARGQRVSTLDRQQLGTGSEHADGSGASDERADLEARLRQAARYEANPAPSLVVVGPIEILIAEGFDLEAEILPVIRDRASRMPKPAQSWAYFVSAIREERDRAARRKPDVVSIEEAISAAKRRLGGRAR